MPRTHRQDGANIARNLLRDLAPNVPVNSTVRLQCIARPGYVLPVVFAFAIAIRFSVVHPRRCVGSPTSPKRLRKKFLRRPYGVASDFPYAPTI
jgi:hypothetical protein